MKETCQCSLVTRPSLTPSEAVDRPWMARISLRNASFLFIGGVYSKSPWTAKTLDRTATTHVVYAHTSSISHGFIY